MHSCIRSALFLFLIHFCQIPAGLADSSQVGDIQYSILNENQFQALHGKEWELLRGQEVPQDSQLRELWGDPHLPDARGVFLRCANHGRCRNEGNPDGTLPIGRYQADTFKKHKHEDQGHTHGLPYQSFMYGNGGHQFHTHTVFINQDLRGSGQVQVAKADLTEVGDQETRPRNITVNVFVKVRETQPKTKEAIQLSSEFMRQLEKTPEFLTAVKNAVNETINRRPR